MERFKKMFQTKAFRAGGYSVFATIIVIAIAIAVMFITDSLPSKITKLDMSQNSIYSISDETKQLVSSLDKDVNIYVISRTGADDTILTNILEKYMGLSDKVTVEVKDPVVNPRFTDKYTSEEVSLNSVIVECGEKHQYIPYEELYEQSYNADYTVLTRFNGEAKITSAIRAVSEDENLKMYVVTGHGETTLSDAATEAVDFANIVTQDLNLATIEIIPSDASCVLIYQPQRDISESERIVLENYINSGGNLMLYTGYTPQRLTNVDLLMQAFGVSYDIGTVLEGDSRYCMRYPEYVIPQIAHHEITEPIISGNYYVLAPYAHPIKLTGEDKGTEITELLTTSENGYVAQMTEDGAIDTQNLGDPSVITLGVVVEKPAESGGGRIVWNSATSMLEAQLDTNTDLFLNSINWMCERGSGVTIHAKSLDTGSLTVSAASAAVWNTVFIFIIPVAFIVLGVYIWIKRRRK